MVVGHGKKELEDFPVKQDPRQIAVYPLAVPYLLNPVGITILIIASDEVVSVASVVLVVGLVLLVGAFDYLIFANIDKLSKRLNPTTLVISEVVFGILLTAVAVQLAVSGLSSLGIITPAAPH
jgi:multiple antibiotic resistance protein